MSLYDDASLIVYPSGYKESKIYAQKPVSGAGDLNFTRASSATRVNEQGLIETASVISPTELVNNGDFATDISGWIQYSSVSTWDSGTIKTTATSNTAWIRQNSILTSSKKYKVTFKAKASNVSQNVTIYNGAVFLDTGLTFNVANTYEEFAYDFDNIASAHLIIGQQSLSIGDSINFDNVSVKEVTTSNVPRIDYTGGGCGSLLLEGQRTNLITESQDFTNGPWTPNGVVATLSSGTAPDGTNTLNDVSSNNSGVQENRFRYATSLAVSTTYTISIFCKVKDINNFYIRDLTGGGGVSIINVATSTALVTGSGSTVSIVDFGSGIKRVIITFTTPSSIGNNLIDFGITSSNTDRQSAIAIGSGMYWWGAQIEEGSYPTSYIPTSGTAETRISDTSSTTGISSVIGQTEGVLYAKIASFTNTSPISSVINISDGSQSNQIAMWYGTNLNEFKILIRQSGNKLFHVTTLTDATQFIKVAVLYKSGGSKVYINGSLITSSTATFAFTNPLSIVDFVGIGLGNADFNGKLQELEVFPSSLDDATLATLTTL